MFNRLQQKCTPRKTNTKTSKSFNLYQVVPNNIRQRYERVQKEKRLIADLVLSERILRKHKLAFYAKSVLKFSRRNLRARPYKTFVNRLRMKQAVQDFFERDDVSTIKLDKQATIIRKGVKRQLCLMTDDMKNLHIKYRSENNDISYSMFCRLCPFWVVKPREKGRKTCMCKIHDNLQLKLKTVT